MNSQVAADSFWKRRGMAGNHARPRSLDLESRQEFLSGFRDVIDTALQKTAWQRAHEIAELRQMRIDEPRPLFELVELFAGDPVISTSVRTWLDTQDLIWQVVVDEVEAHRETYLGELEAAESRGPGTLTLDPALEIPEYCKHEVHRMPGGYTGNPLAGYIFYYGTRSFYKGKNDNGEMMAMYAEAIPAPPDGKVVRILDMGCSDGQYSMAIKRRFADAEVHGIDIGAPMVRFAHMRAADLGLDIHFSQRLAERTGYPDNHFDVVTAYILHHEVDGPASLEIIKEAFRILRPGGLYFPVDAYTGKPIEQDNFLRFRIWWDHLLNNEPWRMEYADIDFFGQMREAGFEVDENGPPSWWMGGERNVVGIKPVAC